MILFENEKNWKEYFFYASSRWKISDSDARLIRSTWADTKLVTRNMGSLIMTLCPKTK